jgi:GNAT superfamily N-acetyltransferase
MKYVVRQVNGNDHEVRALLLRMQRECLPGDAALSPMLGDWWIAYTDTGVPAAFCSLKASVRWEQTGYLSRSGVLPGHRGQGLQKRLIRVRMVRAKRLGWKWLITDTSDNPASANSLIACGFRMYEPSIPYGLKTSIYWRKRL